MGSNYVEGLLVGSGNHAGRDAGVEGNKPALLFDGQRQQIDIGDLFGANNLTPVSNARLQKTDLIGPELMILGGHRLREPLGNEGRRQAMGIRRVGHDP